jgi:hypothetical protein
MMAQKQSGENGLRREKKFKLKREARLWLCSVNHQTNSGALQII